MNKFWEKNPIFIGGITTKNKYNYMKNLYSVWLADDTHFIMVASNVNEVVKKTEGTITRIELVAKGDEDDKNRFVYF